MKHTYHIQGMTCNGCRSHVEKTLSEVEGVTNAAVDLEQEEATLEMEAHIPLETFQKALKEDGGTYSINPPQPPEGGSKKTVKVKSEKSPLRGLGDSFYCPMHCEGDSLMPCD